MEFGKGRDTTYTTDYCPHQLVTDLLRTCRLCCRLVAGKSLRTCYGETGVMDFGVKERDIWHFSLCVTVSVCLFHAYG